MVNEIEKANDVCEVLLNFVSENKGSLDDKGVKEIQSIKDRTGEIDSTTSQSRDGVVKSRTVKNQSFDRLQSKAIECKKTMEIFRVRGGKIEVASLNRDLWSSSRIGFLVTKLLDAARMTSDPVVTKAAAALTTAYDDFRRTRTDTSNKLMGSRAFKAGTKAELAEINGKLNGYTMLIAYHVSPDARAQLLNRVRVARQPKPRKHGEQEKVEAKATNGASDFAKASAATQPTAIPALPTIPTGNMELRRDGVTSPSPVTTVPQTGDHPQLSANA
ncbi:MAG: hypothetical protein HY897_09785 [Deltaproteobacteria bacterium]|nr:hypothetical protein [Deltaproteobacteria bacterium]